jgi:50S ribosomal protein L16 3-hydroxylase
VSKNIPGGMDADEFLKSYWQKKPCLVRQAYKNFRSFISRDGLFSLACQDNVESRIVLEFDGDEPWQLIHGPFHHDDFSDLPAKHWSLLVQNTDLHLPAASNFLNSFDFIPNWRIDDLMVSYAPESGSVGPHSDSYDVFLFQAMGKRKWAINSHDYDENDFIEGLDLRVIENFKAEQEWTLEPGDMLYLPPNVAHHGVALDECMTFSIGFRAPSNHELISHFVDDQLESVLEQRYSDPDLTVPTHSGEISKQNLQDILTFTKSVFPDENDLEIWFGKFVTQIPGNCVPDKLTNDLNEISFLKLSRDKYHLLRNSASRTAFIRKDELFILFINGEAYTLPSSCEKFVMDFTEKHKFDNPLVHQHACEAELSALLCHLYNKGIIIDAND